MPDYSFGDVVIATCRLCGVPSLSVDAMNEHDAVHRFVSDRPRKIRAPIEHGTNSSYTYNGCSCADCRAAHAAYYRWYNAKRKRA